jgi:hypothetical protein
MTIKQIFNTSVELDYPTVLPTLDLDFVNTKTLDPRITFTRASGGSYIGADGLIKYAGVNEARFDHDPLTGESLGLLIEEARTNLLTSSNNFGSGDANYGITASADVSPDGTTNASLIFEKTTLSFKLYTANITAVIGTTYCGSVFVKYSGSNLYGRLKVGANNTIIINLINGSILSSFGTCGVIPYPNGWYRIYVVWTATTTSEGVQIFLMDRTGSNSLYQGDGSSGYYLYGIQAEVGAFPTSYIPTAASTVTRTADNASMTGSNFSSWYRQDEGTMFSGYRGPQVSVPGSIRVATLSDGTFSNLIMFVASNGNGASANFVSIVASNIAQTFDPANPYLPTSQKGAFAYALDNVGYSRNGGSASLDTSATIPTTNVLNIASGPTNANILNGTISQLTYFPKRLPNSQLQALTS